MKAGGEKGGDSDEDKKRDKDERDLRQQKYGTEGCRR
jgi:hypothetical protein